MLPPTKSHQEEFKHSKWMKDSSHYNITISCTERRMTASGNSVFILTLMLFLHNSCAANGLFALLHNVLLHGLKVSYAVCIVCCFALPGHSPFLIFQSWVSAPI